MTLEREQTGLIKMTLKRLLRYVGLYQEIERNMHEQFFFKLQCCVSHFLVLRAPIMIYFK